MLKLSLHVLLTDRGLGPRVTGHNRPDREANAAGME